MITMKSRDIDRILVFLLELEKATCLKEINYSLISLDCIYLLEVEFKLNDYEIETLTNKYNDSLNIINLERVIYLICQEKYILERYTLNEIIIMLKNGYSNNNLSDSLYDILEQIDLLYNTDLSTTFQKGGNINDIY